MNGDTVSEARIVAGAVAPTPIRLRRSEAAVTGKPVAEAEAERAGELAIQGAKVLRHNGFKVPMLRNLVRRVITDSSPDGPAQA